MAGRDAALPALGRRLAARVMGGGRLFVSGVDSAVPSEAQNVAQGLWLVNRFEPRPAGARGPLEPRRRTSLHAPPSSELLSYPLPSSVAPPPDGRTARRAGEGGDRDCTILVATDRDAAADLALAAAARANGHFTIAIGQVCVGLGRIVALHGHSPTLYRIL
jgi:hypothetical protein